MSDVTALNDAQSRDLKFAHSMGVLGELNCSDSLEERAAVLADYLIVVDEAVPDPRDPRKSLAVPRVLVPDETGKPKMIPAGDGSGRYVPYPIHRLVEELTAATIRVRPGQLTCREPRLRWKV